MTALLAGRTTPRREGELYSRPVAAGAKIQVGALVVLNAARFAEAGQQAAGLLADGVSEDLVDNTSGADGAKRVTVRSGVFAFANSAGADALGQADIGAAAFIVDDQTVAKTSNGGARSAAGLVVDIDQAGVWVGVGILHP